MQKSIVFISKIRWKMVAVLEDLEINRNHEMQQKPMEFQQSLGESLVLGSKMLKLPRTSDIFRIACFSEVELQTGGPKSGKSRFKKWCYFVRPSSSSSLCGIVLGLQHWRSCTRSNEIATFLKTRCSSFWALRLSSILVKNEELANSIKTNEI